MNQFVFDSSMYYVTDEAQNYTEAELTCKQNFSEIANLNNLNFEKFSKKVLYLKPKDVLRVRSVSTDFDKCFGTLDLSWIKVDEGLANNVRDICQGNRRFYKGMYKTLCFKPTEQSYLNKNSLTDSSSDSSSPLVAILVTILVLVIFGTLLVVFFFFKKKRRAKLTQKSSVCQIELVESNDVSNYYMFYYFCRI